MIMEANDMGMYRHIREAWKKPETLDFYKTRMIHWRKEPVTMRIDRPTRIDRARSLGYKAKQGIFVVRQRINRGGRMRPKIRAGRRTKHFRQRFILAKSYQWIAEERVSRKFPNCEVLNSYEVAKDGTHYWFEVIMVDRADSSIVKDKALKFMATQRGRVNRGLTASGKRSRGILTHKGKGAEKLRPSLSAHDNRGK